MGYFKRGALVERFTSTATSGGTLTLTNTSTTFQHLTGTSDHTVVLPDATTLQGGSSNSGGTKFHILNASSGKITVNRNGGTLLLVVPPFSTAMLQLVDDSSAAGTWRFTAPVLKDYPLKLRASIPADSKIVIVGTTQIDDDGAEVVNTLLSGTLPSFSTSTHDLQTGATTGATFSGASLPTTTVGQFRRILYTLTSSGTIEVLYSSASATLGALQSVATIMGTSQNLLLGWLEAEATASNAFKTAGSATNIVENSVSGTARVHRVFSQHPDRAMRNLSNLTSTSIPVDLLPSSDQTINVGSNSVAFNIMRAIRYGAKSTIVSFTGDTTLDSTTITNISDTSAINTAQSISGPGIPSGATVASKTSSTVTFSHPGGLGATANGTGVSLQATYMAIYRAEDQTGSSAPGGSIIRGGAGVDGPGGPLIAVSGRASGTGSSGDAFIGAGTVNSGTQGLLWLFGRYARLPRRASDPSDTLSGGIYWNTTSSKTRVANGSAWSDLAGNASGGSSFKNLIINGDAFFDQVNEGTSYTVPAASAGRCLDAWFVQNGASTPSYTVQKLTSTPPLNARAYIRAANTTAASPASTDQLTLFTKIEGYDAIALRWGTSSAKNAQLSFWVRCSSSGTFSGAVLNATGTRSYVFSYTISSADTWEKKEVSIPLTTTGTFPTNNEASVFIVFDLGSGSNLRASAGSWYDADRKAATGAVSLFSSANQYFDVTEAQFEVGDAVTEFERPPFSAAFARCRRYLQTTKHGTGVFISGSAIQLTLNHFGMRAAPTVVLSGVAEVTDHYASNYVQSSTSISINENSADSGRYALGNFSSGTAGRFVSYVTNAAGKIILESAL